MNLATWSTVLLCAATVHAASMDGSSARAALTKEEVRSWLDVEWRLAGEYPPIQGCEIRYLSERYELPDVDRVRSLTEQAKQPGNIVAQNELRRMERVLAGEPRTTTITVWSMGPGRWRIGLDKADHPLPYTDFASAGPVGWTLTTGQLTLVDKASDAGRQRLEPTENRFIIDIGLLLFGGMAIGRAAANPVVESLAVSGEKWQVVVRAEGHFVHEIHGAWSADEGRGFVQSMRVLDSADPSSVDTTWEFSQWREDPVLGRWIAGRAEHRSAAGRVMHVLSLESVGECSEDRWRDLVEIPWNGVEDPIRGVINGNRIMDLRGGHAPEGAIEARMPGGGRSDAPLGFAAWQWGAVSGAALLLLMFIVRRIGGLR